MAGVYQREPEVAPDSQFEPGRLEHVVVGNEGRLLDPRRTPVRVSGIRPDVGLFEVEVLAFEDRGARWELPLEAVERFQFALESTPAGAHDITVFQDAVRRFDRRLDIEIDPQRRQETLGRLARERAVAIAWFEEESVWGCGERTIDLGSGTGDGRLFADLAAFMTTRGLTGLEREFAGRYVSNPSAGEFGKAHAMVVAELGLAPYHGTVLRDPGVLEGDWENARRVEHIVARLAFVHALFSVAGHGRVDLYRGMSFEDAVTMRPTGTFVSATFSRRVAEALSELGPTRNAALLASQRVGVDRLFMTYHETEAMNERFHEAEALLLADPTALF